MADSKLTIKIQTDVAQALSGIESVKKKLDGLGNASSTISSKLKNASVSLGTYKLALDAVASGISFLIKSSKELIDAYSAQEKAETRLATTLKATGNAAGMSAAELYELASSFQSVTTYGDEAIIEVEKLFVASGKISREAMPKAVEATLDMAAAMGEDLMSAAKRLAKVLADPKSNLDALKDANIQLSSAQKENIKQLQESNNLYGAQSLVLQSVEKSYGGVAKAIADTDTGKLTQIKNVWGDIKEGLGSKLLDTISPALDTLYEKLKQISDWIDRRNEHREIKNIASDILNGEWGGRTLNDLSEAELLAIKDQSRFGSWDTSYRKNHEYDFSQENYNAAFERAKKVGNLTQYDRDLYEDVTKRLNEIRAGLETQNDALSEVSDASDDATVTAKELIDKYKSASVTARIKELYSEIETITAAIGESTGEERTMLEEIRQSLYDELTPLERIKNGIEDAADATGKFKETMETVNKYVSTYGSAANSLLSASASYIDTMYSNQISAIDSMLSASEERWDKYLSRLEEKQELQKDSLAHLYDSGLISLEEYSEATKQLYDDKVSAETEAEEEEEKLQEKRNELEEKQFNANKANQKAQAVINGAMAITSIWATHAAHPVTAGILTALSVATTAMQLATIESTKYTPMATGGIVTKPTYALLGEGGAKEAVLPLTETNMERAGLRGDNGGVINISISIGTAYSSDQLSRDVYEGIERAQRTGLLPKWRYA